MTKVSISFDFVACSGNLFEINAFKLWSFKYAASIFAYLNRMIMGFHQTQQRNNGVQRKQMHYSPNLLGTISNAIDNCKLATIEYDSREKGITIRDIEPMAVVYKDGKRHLVGFCHLRNEYRNFRLDRLNTIKLKQESFMRRQDFNVDNFQDDTGKYADDFEEDDY